MKNNASAIAFINSGICLKK